MQDIFIEKPGFIHVTTTCPNRDTATELSRRIVENHLAACVQMIHQVESIYHWQGKIETASEVLLLMKTKMDLFGRLSAFIKQNHSYETPEIIVTPIIDGSDDYLQWLEENLENQ